MAAAVVVGLGAGFGAIIFGWLINNFSTLAFSGGHQALGFLGKYYVIVLPAMGGLPRLSVCPGGQGSRLL
jgi:hypothetical protein